MKHVRAAGSCKNQAFSSGFALLPCSTFLRHRVCSPSLPRGGIDSWTATGSNAYGS
jgi:hypothetical protein